MILAAASICYSLEERLSSKKSQSQLLNTEEAGSIRLPGPELGQPLHRKQPHPGRCPQVRARHALAACGPPCSLPCFSIPAHSGTRVSCGTHIMHGTTNPSAEHFPELIWPEPRFSHREPGLQESCSLSPAVTPHADEHRASLGLCE